jgi:hypothetical protein
LTGIFCILFKVLPDIEIPWRDVLLGAVVTAVLFSIGKLVLGLYLGNASFGSTYGTVGSVIIILVWVYYSARIFFFGAEFTQVYSRHYGTDPSKRLREFKIAGRTSAEAETGHLAQVDAAPSPSATIQQAPKPGWCSVGFLARAHENLQRRISALITSFFFNGSVSARPRPFLAHHVAGSLPNHLSLQCNRRLWATLHRLYSWSIEVTQGRRKPERSPPVARDASSECPRRTC